MLIIAKVADIEILETDIVREEKELCPITDMQRPGKSSILKRLIDSCLLYYEALSQGFSAAQEEYDEELASYTVKLDEIEEEKNQVNFLDEE